MQVNKKKAVALGYNRSQDNAPKVLASGAGEIANKIISLAKSMTYRSKRILISLKF